MSCPAALGKVRCPLHEGSMALGYGRPEISQPPDHPPPCCSQRTITVPPSVNVKTAQKHDYPSAAHRRSYARRSAAERTNATIKDPASTDIARGWCRMMGLTPMTLLLTCALVMPICRVVDSFETRPRRRSTTGGHLGLAPGFGGDSHALTYTAPVGPGWGQYAPSGGSLCSPEMQ